MRVKFIEASKLCCTGALKPDCATMSEYSALGCPSQLTPAQQDDTEIVKACGFD